MQIQSMRANGMWVYCMVQFPFVWFGWEWGKCTQKRERGRAQEPQPELYGACEQWVTGKGKGGRRHNLFQEEVDITIDLLIKQNKQYTCFGCISHKTRKRKSVDTQPWPEAGAVNVCFASPCWPDTLETLTTHGTLLLQNIIYDIVAQQATY
jgi:hypothetical protein